MSLRVLFLANASQIGGGNRFLMTLWGGLRARGVEVAVACPEPGPMVDEARTIGVQASVLEYHQPGRTTPIANWVNRRQWRSLLDRWGPTLIHANGPAVARSVMRSARDRGIPVACHVHFPPGDEYMRWAFRRVHAPDAFVFITEYMRIEMGKYVSDVCPNALQFVIHNAVDLERFTPRRPHTLEGRRVGIVANLMPLKGQEDFLEMAQILRERGVRAEYWLAGADIHDTGYREQLEQLAVSFGVDKVVRFLGQVRDVPAVLAQLDILVCASHLESFGLSVIEAMATGLPVVATRVGGIPEVMGDDACGILVEPQAPGQLADAVEMLLADPKKRQAMGESGRARVSRMFSVQTHVERTLAIYRQILADGSSS